MKQTPQSIIRFFQNDTECPVPALGCILMASGEGRRFGGNKLLAPFLGEPLIYQILSATDTRLITKRVVVTRRPEIAEICQSVGIETVLHDRPYRNDTIRLGLESFGKEPPEGCMFCPCDQPLLSRETLETMARAFIGQPDHIYRLSYQNTPGSPTIFPQSYFSALKTLPQGKGGSYIVHACNAPVRYVEASSAWELKDVDTAEDLKFLEKNGRTLT